MTNIIKNIEKLLGYEINIHNERALLEMFDYVSDKNFAKEKLEKDFYLTIILHRMSQKLPQINFKGGTCLNKIYFPYFRLSEDLDFSLSTQNECVNTNGKREKFAKNFRKKMTELSNIMGRSLNDNKFHHKKAQGNKTLKKKEYTYLKYVLTYRSIYDQSEQTIKIELTYTSLQYFDSVYREIQSIFVDPVLEEKIFKPQKIKCLDLQEMITEKCRACLTRRVPAIRDFFDLRYLQSQGIDILTNKNIIQAKCNEVTDREQALSDNYHALEQQIQTHLLPVVADLYNFNLKIIYDKMVILQKEISSEEKQKIFQTRAKLGR